MKYEEIFDTKTGTYLNTLGNIIECENEYIVYDGSDYIGFQKDRYLQVAAMCKKYEMFLDGKK